MITNGLLTRDDLFCACRFLCILGGQLRRGFNQTFEIRHDLTLLSFVKFCSNKRIDDFMATGSLEEQASTQVTTRRIYCSFTIWRRHQICPIPLFWAFMIETSINHEKIRVSVLGLFSFGQSGAIRVPHIYVGEPGLTMGGL